MTQSFVELEYDASDLEELLNGLKVVDGGLETAVMRALNKAIVSLRAESIRLVREDYNVKAKDVRAAITVYKANKSNLNARLKGEGSPGIPLIAFRTGGRRVPSTYWTGSSPHKKIGGFVKVRVRKDRAAKVVDGGFAAKMASGHIGIFKRDPPQKMRGSKKDAIKELYGPSPEAILASDHHQDALQDKADELMEKNLRHEAEYILNNARF